MASSSWSRRSRPGLTQFASSGLSDRWPLRFSSKTSLTISRSNLVVQVLTETGSDQNPSRNGRCKKSDYEERAVRPDRNSRTHVQAISRVAAAVAVRCREGSWLRHRSSLAPIRVPVCLVPVSTLSGVSSAKSDLSLSLPPRLLLVRRKQTLGRQCWRQISSQQCLANCGQLGGDSRIVIKPAQ